MTGTVSGFGIGTQTRNNIETAPGLIVWQVLALILEMGLSI